MVHAPKDGARADQPRKRSEGARTVSRMDLLRQAERHRQAWRAVLLTEGAAPPGTLPETLRSPNSPCPTCG